MGALLSLIFSDPTTNLSEGALKGFLTCETLDCDRSAVFKQGFLCFQQSARIFIFKKLYNWDAFLYIE